MKEEFELYENAKKRIKQKKRLYFHFIFFLVGSVFLIVLNKVLNVGEPHDWFVWAILVWFFIFLLHFINVFVTNRFMGAAWIEKQTEKLILKQETKIAKLEIEIEKEAKIKAESEQFSKELKEKETKIDSKTNE